MEYDKRGFDGLLCEWCGEPVLVASGSAGYCPQCGHFTSTERQTVRVRSLRDLLARPPDTIRDEGTVDGVRRIVVGHPLNRRCLYDVHVVWTGGLNGRMRGEGLSPKIRPQNSQLFVVDEDSSRCVLVSEDFDTVLYVRAVLLEWGRLLTKDLRCMEFFADPAKVAKAAR